MSSEKQVAKRTVVYKPFRLIDFRVFDDIPESLTSVPASDGSEDELDASAEGGYKEYKQKPTKQFIIQMFGVNEKGETASIYIDNYKPFFFIKVGDGWTQSAVSRMRAEIVGKIGVYYDKQIESMELVHHHKLYGFSGGKKHNFVKVVCKNTIVLSRIRSLWYTTGAIRKLVPLEFNRTRTELYESTIPPLLRYFHIHEISPSGWVKVASNTQLSQFERTTTCTYEFLCKLNNVVPLPEKETRVPYKICSFDIEASSSHGDFPIPVKTYKRLSMNLVDIFGIYADQGNHRALLQRIIFTAFGYDSFNDVDLVYPKLKHTENMIRDKIEILLLEPLDKINRLTTSKEVSRLLNIDHLFEKMNQEINNEGREDYGSDGENSDCEEVDEDAASSAPRSGAFKGKRKMVDKKFTLIDVLLSHLYDRDEKIQIVNDTFIRAGFPPLEGDKVTFIGSTFMRYGESEPYLNHCVVLDTCDDVPGVQIETARTERELLIKWTDLIQKENPDIIIGYNIFGFDYEFMFRRAQENGCEYEFLKFSRKLGELCAKEPRRREGEEEDDDGGLEIEHTTVQLASGEYDLRYFKMSGRLQVDMYTYLRRDFNLSSYKLDDVASNFISDSVNKVVLMTDSEQGIETTMVYTSNIMGLHVSDFIRFELSGFTSDYYKNGKKFKVANILHNYEVEEMVKGEMKLVKYNVIILDGHETELSTLKSVKWCMAKDDVTPQDIFRLSKEGPDGRAIVAKYCVQDCNLVHHLMAKVDVLTGYVEMSRICSVPISFLVFRGQGIKLTSYVAKKCREKDTLMPDLDKSGSNDGYEGAIVLPPKCSMYMDNPVACVDYASLYPSGMISQNYSHDSKVCTKEYDLSGKLVKEWGEKNADGTYKYDNLEGYEYIDIEFDLFQWIRKSETARAVKTKCGKKVCRWAQFPENKKGIMPSILEELLRARSDTRKMAKIEKDPFMQNILDKRQLGYKVTANSLYGQCGAKTSTFYEKDVAASTTATGRMMITYARRIIEEVYGNREYETEKNGAVLTKAEYVYGDSVANYTPVYILYENRVHIMTIDSLADQYGISEWTQCTDEGRETKEYCELISGVQTWTEKGWTPLYRVIRHQLASHKKMVRVLTYTGCVDCTDDHSLVREDGTEVSPKDVAIGDHLLHQTMTRLSEEALENVNIKFTKKEPGFNVNSMIDAAILTNYMVYHGYNTKVYTTSTSNNRFYVYGTRGNVNPAEINKIRSINEIEYSGYVYDLTTENHHFAAGVGNMIVHNTDSVFFTFNLEDPKTGEKIRGEKALEVTIEIAQDAAHLCTQFLKPPMELTYEKTLMPFILLSKKRYVGMLYEDNPHKGKLKYMGLSLKRRDSCDYLKDTYGGILNILMKDNDISKAIVFLENSVSQLVQGNVPMDKLMITKALRSDYKNPQQIAHKVLADRIGKRDPGNKPKPGDRIKFVHIVSKVKGVLQGEKIETPEFILTNKIQVDYVHYITNQLMKPLQQLFGLAVEQIWQKQCKYGAIKTYKKEVDSLQSEYKDDFETFMKKKEKLSSAKIKTLLFDKYLMQIQNERANLQPITQFFGKR